MNQRTRKTETNRLTNRLTAVGAAIKAYVDEHGPVAEKERIELPGLSRPTSCYALAQYIVRTTPPEIPIAEKADGTPIEGRDSDGRILAFPALNRAVRLTEGLSKVETTTKGVDKIFATGHAPEDADWSRMNAMQDADFASAGF